MDKIECRWENLPDNKTHLIKGYKFLLLSTNPGRGTPNGYGEWSLEIPKKFFKKSLILG